MRELRVAGNPNYSRSEETVLQKKVREAMARGNAKGRLRTNEMNRLIAMSKFAQQEDLPQQKMLHKAVWNEDARRMGLSEAEISSHHRQSPHEQIESALYLMRKIDPNAQATMTSTKNGVKRRFDLYKLRGSLDQT